MRLDRLPLRLHLVQGGCGRVDALKRQALLHLAKAALELGIAATQRLFWIDIEVAGQIGDGKEEIADFFAYPGFRRSCADFSFDFRHLFAHLGEYRFRIAPVKADARGLFLDLYRACQSGQAGRHAVDGASRARRFDAFRLSFSLLDALPEALGRAGGALLGAAEDMGVAADHFGGNGEDNVAEGKMPGFLGDAGVIDDLEQQIAQFVGQRRHVGLFDRVGDLIGFLDGIGRDGGEGLVLVPGAARIGMAQRRHNLDKARDIAARFDCGAVVGHGSPPPARPAPALLFALDAPAPFSHRPVVAKGRQARQA